MARNRIEELLVELKFQGGEELKKISSGFRELARATALTDPQIESARRKINDYAKSLGNSEQALKGQIQALQNLRTQATVGGNVYAQLANDVTRLSKTLKGLEEDYKAVGRAAEQTDRQIANQFPARRAEAFRVQIAALRRELDGLSVSSTAYGDKLTEITIREAAFGRARARQGVIAGAQAVGAPLIGAMMPEQELPNTTAALRLQITELQNNLENLDRASEDYVSTARQISNLQEELSRNIIGTATSYDRLAAAENAAIRRAEKIKKIQEYYRTQGPTAPGVGGFRDPATGAMIARGTVAGRQPVPIQQPMLEISGLFQQIGQIGLQPVISQIELMGKSYQDVAQDIRNATAASNGSVQSLQAQRGAWQGLLAQLNPSSKAYREISKELERVDRQLDRVQQRRRRMSAMEATQAAGAVISGGIFGGPEGAIGGGIGAVVGGVPGAFAGAAIGAQVGMIRQAIGSYAEMSAEINRLRQGLAASSNNFTEFTQLVRITEESSKRLLIPLADSYRIMAQLRANTVELGYSLEDTKMLFEGTATAVFQTGGNLNDVQGAMRAIVQVLSKGRPQAEEIRSQLGERLPGAIIKFAQETGRSTEELEQAFKDSEVTVDEFFKFAKRNFKDGEKYYDSLATSAEFAGRRYEKALEIVQVNIGRTFESTGAIVQDTTAAILEDINSLGSAMMDLGLIQSPSYYFEQLLTGALKVEEAEKRVARLRAATKEFDFSFGLRTLLGTDPGPELKALEDALKRLRKFQQGVKERDPAIEKEKEDRAKEQRAQSFLQAIEQRENAIAQARIQLEEQAQEIRKQAVEQTKQLEERFAQQRLSKEREIAQARRELAGVQQDIGFELSAVRAAATGGDPEIVRIQQRITEAARQRNEERIQLEQTLLDEQTERTKAIEELKINTSTAINEANLRYAKTIGDAQREYARAVAKIIEEGTGRAGKRLEAAGRLASAYIDRATAKQAFTAATGASIIASGKGYQVAEDVFSAADLLEAAKRVSPAALTAARDFIKATEAIQNADKALASLPTATGIAGPAISSINVNIDDLIQTVSRANKALGSLSDKSKAVFEKLGQAKFAQQFVNESAQAMQGILGLRESLQSEYDKIIGVFSLRREGKRGDFAERFYEIQQSFESALAGLDAAYEKAAALVDPKDLAGLEEFYKNLKDSLFSAQAAAIGFAEALTNIPANIQIGIAIENIKDQLAELSDPAKQIINAATAIGDAFSNSFKGLITGATSAREALAGFFSSVADYFADMAARMIAEWIKLAILNTIFRIFNPTAGAGLSDLSAPATINNPLGVLNANGNAFAQNGIVPYAKGGIVNRPTMFKFARGGTMQTGLMGEAGPEAIMPLKRGADGKLGVAATGGGSGVTVNVSVDAKGTQVQGDPGQGAALGRVIAGAVQAELIKQQRPGGLLANTR
jgi:tape measure domain-containing protein